MAEPSFVKRPGIRLLGPEMHTIGRPFVGRTIAAPATVMPVLSPFASATTTPRAGPLSPPSVGAQRGGQPRGGQSSVAVLAAHAAAALLASQHHRQLQTALSSRDRIGQAKGIIMERFKVDDLKAFDMLRQLSQESNVRLIDIAAEVIASRE
ncbi:hypothetical protein MMUR_06400 [Mycolicibacterium murale]|uniref:ANTAR domain-containing protein n=1 Tax=Mycolicibacterium murale TaxID=182220 RepID=A0A7I9WFP0_9MYCO|nr:hypothetical protein MMUR_06400 [Mycolicibacterium murale]